MSKSRLALVLIICLCSLETPHELWPTTLSFNTTFQPLCYQPNSSPNHLRTLFAPPKLLPRPRYYRLRYRCVSENNLIDHILSRAFLGFPFHPFRVSDYKPTLLVFIQSPYFVISAFQTLLSFPTKLVRIFPPFSSVPWLFWKNQA